MLLLIVVRGEAQQRHLLTLTFQSGKTKGGEKALQRLNGFCDSLRVIPGGFRLEVIGHADQTGDSLLNIRISEERAEWVAQQLKDCGLASQQISIGVFGENAPINRYVEKHAGLNRRVEIILSPIAKIDEKKADKPTNKVQDSVLIYGDAFIFSFRKEIDSPSIETMITCKGYRFKKGEEPLQDFLCAPVFSGSDDRCISFYAMAVLTIKTDNYSANCSIYIPVQKPDPAIEIFRQTASDKGMVWQNTHRKPEITTHNGKTYYRIADASGNALALGKEIQGFCENPATATLLSKKHSLDSIYLVYNNDTIHTRFDYKPDGNVNSPNHFQPGMFYPALQPDIILFLHDEKQVYTLRLSLSDLKKIRGKTAYRIPGKRFRKKQVITPCSQERK